MPYPPNYGGIIDIFYKLKALSELGIEIYLHTFEYGRGKPDELEKFCKEIFYYKRKSGFTNLFSKIPFIVESRSDEALINNLKKINAPILFEGLHTTFPLINENFEERKLLIRAHNIEHSYYNGLAKSEERVYKKIFFKLEAKKLETYEKILKKADKLLAISPYEYGYFSNKFFDKVIYIPVFHQNSDIKNLSSQGDFVLYHGDLRVSDNVKAVYFLINLFKNMRHKLVVASSFNNKGITDEIAKYQNIEYTVIKNQDHLIRLLNQAHINVLPTYQKTGIKLKLINALYNGRFCIVTNEMIEDTGLEDLCIVCKTEEGFTNAINRSILDKYEKSEIQKRERILKSFDTNKNAEKIIKLLY